MIPIYQDKFEKPDGNCTAACLASIFELDIRECEHWRAHYDDRDLEDGGEHWTVGLNRWLATWNLTSFIWSVEDGRGGINPMPKGYAILSGLSPRGDWGHATVSYFGDLIHDPFADATEPHLIDYWDWTTFHVLDRSKPCQLWDRLQVSPYVDWPRGEDDDGSGIHAPLTSWHRIRRDVRSKHGYISD